MTPSRPSPLRAVHLINHLGRGGTERQLSLVLSHLDQVKWESHVVVFNPSHHLVYDDALQANGVRIWNLPPDCRGIRRRLPWVIRLLRRLRPSIVHSWTVHDNAYAAVAGRLAGVPLRWGSLRGSPSTPGIQSLPAPIRFLVFRGVQRLVVNCRDLKHQLTQAGIPLNKILVLPNCVELPDPYPPAADLSDLGVGNEEAVVGSIGNLRRVKNHEMFVRAMGEVCRRRPDVRGLIAGQPLDSEPTYGAELETEIQRLALERQVILAGFRGDVPPLLQRLAVVCLSSHTEGMPNAVLEAMAAGRPVVAVRIGGVPELIEHGVNGLLVDPGDDRAMAEAILRILDSPEEAMAMGREGRRRAERHHSCRAAAERIDKLYQEALS